MTLEGPTLEDIKEMNLFQRLHACMGLAGQMGKGGYNEHSRYTYVKASDVAKKFQELLLLYRVFCTASVEEVVHQKTQTATGKPSMFVGVKVRYTFINIDDPEDKFEVIGAGDGMDSGDKGLYKALTGSEKYLFSLNFCMGSDDDAETDSPEIGGNTKTAQKANSVASPASHGPTTTMF